MPVFQEYMHSLAHSRLKFDILLRLGHILLEE